jgi:hypothetical protein
MAEVRGSLMTYLTVLCGGDATTGMTSSAYLISHINLPLSYNVVLIGGWMAMIILIIAELVLAHLVSRMYYYYITSFSSFASLSLCYFVNIKIA